MIQNWFDQAQPSVFQSDPSSASRPLTTRPLTKRSDRSAADRIAAAAPCQPRRTRFRTLCGLSVLLALGGCSFNNLFGGHAPPPVVEKSDSKAPDDYIIGSGDQLSIFVYRNPDLSEGGVAVRPDGRISTPLIEDIVASGKTPTQLAREIEQRLGKYIQEPNVTVIVRGFIGPPDRQVRVIGEATDPIAIPYRDHMTLLDVMIATKGLTKYAAGNRAVIVRIDPDGKQQTIKVRLSDLIKDRRHRPEHRDEPRRYPDHPAILVLRSRPAMDSVRVMLSQYLRAAWRRRWMGVIVAWLVCGMGWVGVYTIPNQFESGARLFVDADAVLTPLLRGLAADSAPTTQLEILQRTLLSRPNMEKLVSKTDLDLTLNSPSDRERLLTRLAAEIKVMPQTKNLFTITYRDKSPKLAHDVVQTLLTIFVESATGGSRSDMENARRFLERQIQSYEQQLRAAEKRRADFRARYIEILPADNNPNVPALEGARTRPRCWRASCRTRWSPAMR